MREARITPTPTEELFYSDIYWKGYVDLEMPVYASTPLEVVGRLIAQQADAPMWLIPIPMGAGNGGVATLTQWRATCQPPEALEPIDVTAYDPLVAATTLLHMIINRTEINVEPQEATPATDDRTALDRAEPDAAAAGDA